MTNVKNILCRVFIIFVSLILLIPFIFTVILSFVDYSVLHGLFGSTWVGWKNIVSFFSSAHFSAVAANTAKIGVMSLIIGAVYVFAASMAIGSAEHPLLKGIMATVFCVPAVIPISLFVNVLPAELLMKPSFLLQLTVAAGDGLKLAGLVVIAAIFIKNYTVKESIGCTLLYIAIRLIGLFTVDTGLILSIYNPLTYEVLDTISTFTYRTSLLEGSYSYSAGVYIAKVMMQLIPAVGACFVLTNIFKRKTTLEIHNNSLSPAAIAVVIPAVILIAVLIKGSSLFPTTDNELIIGGYINGFLMAFPSALFTSLLAVLIAILARNAGVIGIIALTALCITVGNTMGEFMMIRSAGLAGTLLGVIVQNCSMVSIIALIYAFITKSERNISKDISVFVVGGVMLFARFWGDFMSPMMLLKDRSTYPLALIVREVMIGSGAEGQALSSLPFILIPLAVVAAGIIITAFLMSKNISPKSNTSDI